ncbi:hypothetical protein K3729_05915 [Rhodobacteraceae bacterium S2214]|nr:hypothetical protein K3729_05915 [Rhodobacteraceae bacterium S2214]
MKIGVPTHVGAPSGYFEITVFGERTAADSFTDAHHDGAQHVIQFPDTISISA